MTKTKFQEMFEKDVNAKVEKKNGLSYLSWAWAWAEAKKVDENASYEIHENAEGNPFFVSSLGIDCKVSVTICGRTHTMRLPVMDFKNKAMKLENATAVDVNKTIMRCLVKAIAMHGLGLYIYAGEDLPEEAGDAKQEQKTAPTLKAAMAEAKATGERIQVGLNATSTPAAMKEVTTPEEKLVAANPENKVNGVPKSKGWGKPKATVEEKSNSGDLY